MEKPYLQDLFEYMSDEHGLTLLQSEMQQIVDICLGQNDYNYLRDVLKEIVKASEMEATNGDEYDKQVCELDKAILKAKQLLTEKL